MERRVSATVGRPQTSSPPTPRAISVPTCPTRSPRLLSVPSKNSQRPDIRSGRSAVGTEPHERRRICRIGHRGESWPRGIAVCRAAGAWRVTGVRRRSQRLDSVTMDGVEADPAGHHVIRRHRRRRREVRRRHAVDQQRRNRHGHVGSGGQRHGMASRVRHQCAGTARDEPCVRPDSRCQRWRCDRQRLVRAGVVQCATDGAVLRSEGGVVVADQLDPTGPRCSRDPGRAVHVGTWTPT